MASASTTLPIDSDVEGSRLSRSTIAVPNVGSTARDHCTTERTLLAYTRLGLILFILSSSLLLKARIPTPDDDGRDDPDNLVTFPLGIVYSMAAIIVLLAGWMGYESDLKGLLSERAFVGGFHLSEAVVIGVALLLFATCILLLREGYQA
ncbi:hypothetical protein FRC09_015458 [Ceratobasidium sp. 395]|nr:hypothetical protein FRC09_015458 [Ceratobasidium sp. 395]